MPVLRRKAKGRRKARKDPPNTEEQQRHETGCQEAGEAEATQKAEVTEEVTQDEIKIKEAKLTIQRLQRKYLHKATQDKQSFDIVSSPEFKVPKPTLGHSTPSPVEQPRRDSLFGFESLDSPLALSPVAASPYVQEESLSFKIPEGKIKRSSSYSSLLGTYDIPLRQATSKKQVQKRKEKEQKSAEMDAWAAQLNAQFADVDNFDLVVQ